MRWPTTSSASAVRVPQLVGLALRAAQDLALDAGLLAVLRRPCYAAAGYGTVIRQSPPAGTEVPVGTRVSLWVSPPPDPSDNTDGDDTDDGGRGGGGSRVPTPPGPKVPAGTNSAVLPGPDWPRIMSRKGATAPGSGTRRAAVVVRAA